MVGTLTRNKKALPVADNASQALSAFPKTRYTPSCELLVSQSKSISNRLKSLKDQALLDRQCQEIADQIEERARKLIQSYERGHIDLRTFEQHKKEILGAAAAIGLTLLVLTNFNPKVEAPSRAKGFFSTILPKVELSQSLPASRPNLSLSSATASYAEVNRQAMLKVIRFAEGTADDRGYNRIFGGQEIDDLTHHPDICVKFRRTCSTAAGAYQFLTTTWNGLGLGEFTPTNQDKGAIMLIERRGALGDVDAGRFEDAIAKLSPEWASLPRWEGDPTGTYKQPVKSMSELRDVYLSHGGKLAAQMQATAPKIPVAAAKSKTGNLISHFFKGNKAQAAVQPQKTLATQVVDKALSWVGRDYKYGETARCADFVRYILGEVGLSVPVSTSPIDKDKSGDARSPLMAQSFFGEDVGKIVWKQSDLKPGDLVAFVDTYGNYAKGTITHVGIYIGDGIMVDRSTSSKPIFRRSINTFKFLAGVRPHAYK